MQGSAIGPACFIISTAELQPKFPGNDMSKYADDCHLIVPSTNSHVIPDELNHIATWAKTCNLHLNKNKTKEIIITRRNSKITLPPPLPFIERVTTMSVLGYTFDQHLSPGPHIDSTIAKAHQRFYGLKILKNYGASASHLHTVCNAIVLSILFYAAPAWWGFAQQTHLDKLDGILKKAFKWGYLSTPP